MTDQTTTADVEVEVAALWAGDRGRPRFLPDGRPVLSWSVRTEVADWAQASAEIEVRRGDVVTAHHVDGGGSQRVAWPAEPIGPYASAAVRVRVEGIDGSRSEPSDWVELVTGPLGPDDWQADLIGTSQPMPARGTVRLRTVVDVPVGLASALLSVTAHGVYEAVVGGHLVGDEVLAPGWTSYADVLSFQTYDVTALLTPGERTVLGATLAEGWYGERFGFDGSFAQHYPGAVGLAAQLRMVDADGGETTVVTDPSWQTSVVGPVVAASIYQGESYDARLADGALADPEVALPGGTDAVVVPGDRARLVPAWSPPVRRHEEVPVRQVLTSPSGATVLDFGQNLVGWLRLRATGPVGTTITLRHAEVLEDGELGVRPLRFAAATDTWVLAGTGEVEEFSPRFTYHGFRYAEVAGWPGELDPADVRAVVVHSDMVRTGHLTTGDTLLDQLHSNVVWGMRGNFLSLPTDCPQRDERLGWTGDIQVFAPTASYLFDTTAFLGSWLRDLAADQARRGGVVPFVVPSPLVFPSPAAAAWGDAATLVPTTLWQRYADRAVLERQYPSMRAWVEVERALAGDDDLWTGGFQFGDWLDPAAPPENPAAARTDPDIVASAYFYRSTVALAQAAALLGHDDDARTYATLAERIGAAFRDAFVTPSGRMVSDAQTAYAVALTFGLVPDPVTSERVAARLAELVRAFGYRIGTGFVGTPLILDALTSSGHAETAYRLLQQTECPSWLYSVTMGATTVWERWDSMLPDGSINPGEMTSFNHYALGAVADWMHRSIGGIAPGSPGYAMVDVAPVPGGRVRQATASLDTGYGLVEVAWTWQGGTFRLDVRVPPNSRARVTLPGESATVEVGSGRHHWETSLAEPLRALVPITLDSPLAAVMDDDEAREALLDAFAATGYVFPAGWTSQGRWRSDATVRQSMVMISTEQIAAAEAALADLAVRRVGR